MRPDMKEVLITKGRDGSSHKRNDYVRRLRRTKPGEEDCGGRETMRHQCDDDMYDAKYKRLGEHLTPLYRYLNSKVGQHWDDIWSEIKANNPANSGVGAHIYTHIDVELHPYFIDGYPHYPEARSSNYGVKSPQPGRHFPLRPGSLYVDLQGILCKAPKTIVKPEEQDICVIKIHPKKYLVKNKKGIWFVFEYNNTYRTEQYYDRVWDKKATEEQEIPEGKTYRPAIYKQVLKSRQVPTQPAVYVPLADAPVHRWENENVQKHNIELNRHRQYRLVPNAQGYYCTKIYQASSEDIKRWVSGLI